jgi:UrcA family protein
MTRILAFACLSLVFAGQAGAQEVPSRTVTYRSGDLDSDAGARALHGRIERAARSVCRTGVRPSTDTAVYEDACRKEAVERAVRTVDAPNLTAAHGQTRPYLLARGGEGA